MKRKRARQESSSPGIADQHSGHGGVSLAEVAAELGLARETVRRIEIRAMRKLKKALKDKDRWI